MKEKRQPWPVESHARAGTEAVFEPLPADDFITGLHNLAAKLGKWRQMNRQEQEEWTAWANASPDWQQALAAVVNAAPDNPEAGLTAGEPFDEIRNRNAVDALIAFAKPRLALTLAMTRAQAVAAMNASPAQQAMVVDVFETVMDVVAKKMGENEI